MAGSGPLPGLALQRQWLPGRRHPTRYATVAVCARGRMYQVRRIVGHLSGAPRRGASPGMTAHQPLGAGAHEEWVCLGTADNQLLAEMWREWLAANAIPARLAPTDVISFL